MRRPSDALLALLAIAGCGTDASTLPAPSANTSVVISVTTTGAGVRPANYLLRIDSTRTVTLPASGSLTVADLTAGPHQLGLEGVPEQCIADWVEPQSVTTRTSGPVDAGFRVHCVVPLRGELTYSRGVLPDNARDLWAMRPDGSGARSLGVRDGILSPQGTLIAHHLFDGATRVVSVDGVIDVLIGPRYTGPLAWSPDGRYVALSSNPLTLTIARADGRGSRTLSGIGNGVFSAAAWSPDGRELALVDAGALRVLNVVSGSFRTLPRASATAGISWSPSGDRLAFFSEGQPGRYRLVTLRPDGTDERIVASDIPGAFAITWPSEGGSFLFSAAGLPGASASALLDLYSVATDGTGMRNLTQTPTIMEWSGALTP